MADSFYDKVIKSINKPVIPEKPEEEIFPGMVVFPDKDATEEEIAEYLKTGNIEE